MDHDVTNAGHSARPYAAANARNTRPDIDGSPLDLCHSTNVAKQRDAA
jgi:hypothetical protein